MTQTITKHELAAEVERASEGRQTVLKTAKGQATYMNVIPAFNCEDLGPGFGTGRHPAFIVNGVEKSEIFIATYQAVIRDGEAVSLPGQDPATGINFDQARMACAAAGTGFHLMTNWEWAAIALWCIKNGFGQLRGNTNYGTSHAARDEAGTISQYGRILTGSGPATWRHDGTPYGIADLVGNVWEWCDGLKLLDGRIIMPADNAFGLAEDKWADAGAAIDFADGSMRTAASVTKRDWDGDYFRNVAAEEGFEPPAAIKQALLSPHDGMTSEGFFWADNTEGFEALPIRGGGWGYGGRAGLAALHLVYGRSYARSGVGFRPAFIG